MSATDLYIASFWTDHRSEIITAIVTVLVALALAWLADRALSRRAVKLATSVTGRELSATADTRLRLLRRLVTFTIIVIGVALALAQFGAVKRVATGVLASSAVLGLVVGFAARQTLANLVAGILLAITQPIRVGDLVTFQGETGTVEDVRLSYTFIRAGDGKRVVIPNEQLASSTIINHTIVDPRVRVEVFVWIPVDADPVRALAALSEEPDADVAVADMEIEGIKLSVAIWASSAADRAEAAAGLRVRCIERLQQASILGT
ncbi:MAG TPA: mechanosensitive ion channel domain-containing protein [Thermoleophilaceae bacterium]|jgi:small-conductance mechanosensitive channel